MNYVFLDFETFYDQKNGYGLKALSMVEYVRDARFKVFGFGVAFGSDNPEWYGPKDIGVPLLHQVEWRNAAIVCHNAKFDGLILAEKFGINPKQWIDTKAMARAVLGKTVKSYSLKDLAEHFGLPAKGQLKTDGLVDLTAEQEKELAEYCCHDVWLCRELFNRLNKDFPESQYEAMDWTVRSFVNPKLALNVPLLEQTNKNEAQRREAIFADIGIAKEVFASNVKFPKLLEEKGYEVPKKVSGRTGKEIPALALGDVGFIEMAAGSASSELKKLCEARIAAKSTLLETRSLALASIGKTGAWPFDVEFSGATQTHRFSGGGGAGGNPQNFTRGSALRDAVEAPEGYKLIVGDFSNIELRIVAYLSKDPGLIQSLERGIDLYCDFASAFFGRVITKADKKERQFGKCAILGLGYGMGAKKFKTTVKLQTDEDIPDEEATRAVNLYRRRYTRVPALWDTYQKHIEFLATARDRVLQVGPVQFEIQRICLPSGLKLRFPGLRQEGSRRGQPEWVYDVWRKKEEKETTKLYGGKVLENISQALAGELCKEVLVRMKDKCVGQVHDELHLLEKTAMAHVTAARLKREMETAPSWLPEMKLAAEVKIGKSWGEAK